MVLPRSVWCFSFFLDCHFIISFVLFSVVDKIKESTPTVAKQKQKERKVNMMDEQLKARQQDMMRARMKSTFFLMVIMVIGGFTGLTRIIALCISL